MNLLFNLLIFSIPFGVLTRLNPIPGVSLYVHDIIAGLIFTTFLYDVLFKREKVLNLKLFVLASLFIFVGFISLIFSSSKLTLIPFLISFAYLLRFVSYVSIIFASQFLSNDFKINIYKKLVLSGATFVFFGFIQYAFYPALSINGWDIHIFRLFSTFLDPNFAGIFLVLFLTLLSELLIRSKDSGKAFFPLFLLWMLTLIATILTYSRSAFLALLISTLVVFSIHRLKKLALIVVASIVILFIVFSNRTVSSFSKRPFVGSDPFRVVSAEARITSAKEAIVIISKNPIFGVGFDAYRFAQSWYGIRSGPNMLGSHSDAGTDNSYLFVLATTGIVGFLVFADFLLNVLKSLYRNLNSEQIYSKVAFASIIGLMVDTIFINSLFYSPIMGWIFLIIGLGIGNKSSKSTRESR